jgi:hypothetical protein
MAVDVYGNPIHRPSQPGNPRPSTRPAWLDNFPWLDRLPGDPMLWVIMGGALSFFVLHSVLDEVGKVALTALAQHRCYVGSLAAQTRGERSAGGAHAATE